MSEASRKDAEDLFSEAQRFVLDAGLTLFVGPTDSGKSTLAAKWGSLMCRQGLRCAVVDADVGQSDIGPPGTIGMGRLRRPVQSLGEVPAESLYFVGAFSPRERPLECLTGLHSMVKQARRLGAERILVDTTGFIKGTLGRRLKLSKADLLDPDLIVCLERSAECEFLAKAYPHGRPRIIRIPTPPGVRRRSIEQRTANRLRALARHTAGGWVRQVDLQKTSLVGWPILIGPPLSRGQMRDLGKRLGRGVLWGERMEERLVVICDGPLLWRSEEILKGPWGKMETWDLSDFNLRLVGIDDLRGETRWVGILVRLLVPEMKAEVWAPPSAREIGGLRLGEASITPEQFHYLTEWGREYNPTGAPKSS